MKNITPEVIAEIEEYADTLERGITLAVETGKDAIEKYFRAEVANARAFLAHFAGGNDTTPVAPKQSAQRAASAPRCGFHSEIRRFFAIARERGLDTKAGANESMRRAFENFFCRPIESRAELNARDWADAADAVKSNRLAW
jgi:hypothetical protein